MKASRKLSRIFFWPTLLGCLTLSGLILALVRDNWQESLALVFLGIPLFVVAYGYYFKTMPGEK